MSKHTEGKWTVGNIENKRNRFAIDDDGYPVAEVVGKANANLIASAPEMLDIVKEIIQYVEGNGLDRLPREEACTEDFTCTLYYHFAKDLLAKAEGGAK